MENVNWPYLSSLFTPEFLFVSFGSSLGQLSNEFIQNMWLSSLSRLCLTNFNFNAIGANCFAPMTQLRMLAMIDCANCSHVELDCLPRLEWLVIESLFDTDRNYLNRKALLDQNSFELPRFERCESLRVLELRLYESTEAEMTTRLGEFQHKGLVALEISSSVWPPIHNHWLSRFPNLTSLKLNSVHPEKADFDFEILSFREDPSPYGPLFDTPSLFTGLDNLVSLDIRRNSIGSIHPEAFRGLVCLKRLDLSGNGLTFLKPSGLFAHLVSLEHLDLSYNKMSRIESGALNGLDKLKKLLLRQNELTELIPDVFADLHDLEHLDLSSNRLQNLTPNVIAPFQMNNLRHLNICQNFIRQIDFEMFKNRANFETLGLDWHRIKNKPLDRTGFENVKIGYYATANDFWEIHF